jgi:hypothetical protein
LLANPCHDHSLKFHHITDLTIIGAIWPTKALTPFAAVRMLPWLIP